MDIRVQSNEHLQRINNFWNNIHFHPTDAIEDEWGKYVLDKVSQDRIAKHIRMFAMLEDVVSKDAQGNLVYDFTETDLRIDYMVEKGFDLLICFNWMPLAIAEEPDNLSHLIRYKNKRFNRGKPKDYKVWQEVCKTYTEHIVERYGKDRVLNWYFHCWNEPDSSAYWQPYKEHDIEKSLSEYIKLYDHFAEGVLSVCDKFKVGGPSVSLNYDFIEKFLHHTKKETNHATGKTGTRFDFFSVHTYGMSPVQLDKGEPHSVKATLNRTLQLKSIVDKCGYKDIEIFVDEWEASYSGFVGIKEFAALAYRNDEFFSAFLAKLINDYTRKGAPVSKLMICLSGQHNLTTDFMGHRNFFTLNGFPKPIYNAYALTAKLGNILLLHSCKEDKNIGVFPTMSDEGKISIMLYYMDENYHKQLDNKRVSINVDNLNGKYKVRHYRIDRYNCNSHTMWRELGCPANPNLHQREQIKQASKLKLWYPQKEVMLKGVYSEDITMSQNSVSLIELIPIN